MASILFIGLLLAAYVGPNVMVAGAAESIPGRGFLPNNRAWEMVSPPSKNGGDVTADSRRTRAAAGGDALQFSSLAGFGDSQGITVASDYLAQRSSLSSPGNSGWATHGILPQVPSLPLRMLTAQYEPRYEGEFSNDMNKGIFLSFGSPTNDPYEEEVGTLVRRTNLRTPGTGTYDLLTACGLCEDAGTPLPPPPVLKEPNFRPLLASASPDLDRVAYVMSHQLTADSPVEGIPRLYEWDLGSVRFVGRVPVAPAIACDDAGASTCISAATSIGGASTEEQITSHMVSDGSGGHKRTFFTAPPNPSNTTLVDGYKGNIYMRVDGTETVQLNASERQTPAQFSPATFFDAAANGSRVFFNSNESLTEDAPVDSEPKLYMYDTTKPASEPDNLTFINRDAEPADDTGSSTRSEGVVGVSNDGQYLYFAAAGQLVSGEPLLKGKAAIYLWHDGAIRFIAPLQSPFSPEVEENSSIKNLLVPRQARVTPDGIHLLFSTYQGTDVLSRYGVPDYDHGSCVNSAGTKGCREFYLFSADTNTLQCASCNPNGAKATVDATTDVREFGGGSQTSTHETTALSNDGRFAFFTTSEPLAPEDSNGVGDAYVFDSATGEPRLLSSGEGRDPSYMLDASADGSDAFFTTRERLSGWDVDSNGDIYDARVNGGFPEPLPPPPSCQGDACQPAPLALNDSTPGSATIAGAGNRSSRGNVNPRCGKRKQSSAHRGKARCGKSRKKAKSKRRSERTGNAHGRTVR